MNIEKLVKIYFIFVMSIVAMATLSYNDTINRSLKATVSFFDVKTSGISAPYSVTLAQADYGLPVKRVPAKDSNPYFVNLDIKNIPDESFVLPGTEDKEIMKLVFKTNDGGMELSELKFSVVGVDAEMVRGIRLVKPKAESGGSFDSVIGDEILAKGVKEDDKFVFKSPGYGLDPTSSVEISVRVDLSSELGSNDRVRLDIVDEKDISLKVGGKPFSFKKYPIQGKFLSVVGVDRRVEEGAAN